MEERGLAHRHQAVIVTMAVMGKMQMPIDEKIGVVAMRHGFVAAIGAVDV